MDLFIITALISVFLAGVLTVVAVRVLEGAEGERRESAVQRLRWWGAALVVITVLPVVLAGIQVGLDLQQGGKVSDEAATALAIAGIAAVPVLMGIAFIQGQARRIVYRRERGPGGRPDRRLTWLESWGWLQMIATSSVGPLIMLLPGVSALGRWLRAYRLDRHGSVLWGLALAAREGQPLAEELDDLAERFRGKWRDKLLDAAQLVREGQRLSDVLLEIRDLVPASAIATLRAGEASGDAAGALLESAQRLTRDFSRNSGSGWMVGRFGGLELCGYLWFMLNVTLLILTFLMYFIMPKFKKIFEDFDMNLPALTTALIRACDKVAGTPWVFVAIAVAVGWAVRFGKLYATAITHNGTEDTSFPWWDWLTLRELGPPVFRALAGAAAARSPLEPALSAYAEATPKPILRKRLQSALGHMTSGQTAWEALHRVGLLGAGDCTLLQTAAQAGTLPWTLRKLAETQDARQTYRWLVTVQVLRPVVLVGLGLCVGFVVVAMFLPLISMIASLS